MKTYLDVVGAATTGDLAKADLVRANYMGATANYVDGGTAPDIKKYLDDGDAILNTIAKGGEGTSVPLAFSEYALAVRNSLVSAHEQDRQFYLENALKRTNAAMVYAQEAAQRLSNLRSYIEQSDGYANIANTFARSAEDIIAEINACMQEAAQYMDVAGSDMLLADRFRTEGNERRNEAYSIWRDRRQYIGDFVGGSTRQMPSY